MRTLPSARSVIRFLTKEAACPIHAAAPSRNGWDRKSSPYAPELPTFRGKWIWIALLFLIPIPTPSQSPVVLDKVVAVVNRHAILASDIDDEIRLSVLDPARAGQGILTRQRALDQLISRSLIEQQIRRDDALAAEPSPDEVKVRLSEIRRELPACLRQNCASDEGWKAFLDAHDLTPERVDAYLSYRLEILGFIEERFRPGIHISPQDIENYYRETFVPQFQPGEVIPTLEKVSPRIEEILLQQQVTLLFDEWLDNLRKQGDVELLDPTLGSDATPAPAPPTQPIDQNSNQNSGQSAAGKGSQ